MYHTVQICVVQGPTMFGKYTFYYSSIGTGGGEHYPAFISLFTKVKHLRAHKKCKCYIYDLSSISKSSYLYVFICFKWKQRNRVQSKDGIPKTLGLLFQILTLVLWCGLEHEFFFSLQLLNCKMESKCLIEVGKLCRNH